jgi:hypothetical protein
MDPWPPIVVHPPVGGRRRVTVDDGVPLGDASDPDEVYALLAANGWDEPDLVPDDVGLIEWRGGGPDRWT